MIAQIPLVWLPRKSSRRLDIKIKPILACLIVLYSTLIATSMKTTLAPLATSPITPTYVRTIASDPSFSFTDTSYSFGNTYTASNSTSYRGREWNALATNISYARSTTSTPKNSMRGAVLRRKNTAGTTISLKRTKPKKIVHRGPRPNAKTVTINPLHIHRDLNDFYHNLVLPNGRRFSNDPTKVWNSPNAATMYPQWMRDYLNWHDFKRQTCNRETFSEERWLVMQCLKGQRNCGGISDRLKPITYMLRVAYYSRRILIIHWTKPHSLTDFLVPPQGGVDWRASPWLAALIEAQVLGQISGKTAGHVLEVALKDSQQFSLARMVMQDYHAGRFWYDDQLIPGELNFEKVFHHIWKIFFTPAPAVRQRLESAVKEMDLIPYKYTAAHCRVLYAKDDRPQFQQQSWAENAVNCASELRPQMTIFFTSDSADATVYAQKYGDSRNATVKTRVPDPNPPLHIEFGGRDLPASDYMDGFVDLYIMAEADCVTYNKGGYGLLGLLMGRNATCGLRQDAMDRPKIHNPCHWVDDDPWNSTNEHTRTHYVPDRGGHHGHVYLEPMHDPSP